MSSNFLRKRQGIMSGRNSFGYVYHVFGGFYVIDTFSVLEMKAAGHRALDLLSVCFPPEMRRYKYKIPLITTSDLAPLLQIGLSYTSRHQCMPFAPACPWASL